MKLSNVINVIDCEHDDYRLLEVGLTTVDLKNRKILKTYSLPILPWAHDREVSDEIFELTGWNNQRLTKRGFSIQEVRRRLVEKHGYSNRLAVVDTNTEIEFLSSRLFLLGYKPKINTLNISILFALVTGKQTNMGLEGMLKEFGLEFEGKRHSASDDSKNLARLFLALYDKIRI